MRTTHCTLSVCLLLAMAGHAAGQCSTVGKITGPSPAASDNFAAAVAMSFGGPDGSPLMAVGMPNEDAPVSGTDAGGFTIYKKVNGWSVLYSAWNTTGQGGEQLGASIALSDPYLICGAPGYNSDTGRARIYTRSSSSFLNPVDLVGFATGPGNQFGASVAISSYGGGWAVVGCPNYYFHGLAEAGAAFFYTRDVNGVWSNTFTIRGGDFGGDNLEHRGTSVAMSQSTEFAAVGCPNGENSGQPTDHGIVEVVQRLANGLPSGAVAHLAPPSPEAGEHFGAAVAIEGEYLVVGSPDEDMTFQETGFVQQAIDGGAIYIYRLENGTWTFKQKLRSPAPMNAGGFGAKVATDGKQIVVSEPGSKRAYVFSRAYDWYSNFSYQGAFSDPDSSSLGGFGSSVAVRNGEVAVGDMLDDHTSVTDAGAVYVSSYSRTVDIGDVCSDALTLEANPMTGCTEFATAAGSLTTCGGGGTGPDVWYQFTPACDGSAIIDTFGSEFDTVLSVHAGCPNLLGNNSIACNDDHTFPAPNNRASLVTFNFTAGQTYYVRVAGYNGAKGAFTIRPSFYTGLTNDSCGGATVLGLGDHPFTNCLANSGTDNGVGLRNHDVWFKHTATQSGPLNINTCSVSFDSIIQVYGGPGVTCSTIAQNFINGDDDGCGYPGSNLTIDATAGDTYFIRVSSFSANDTGTGTLHIGIPPACNADYNQDGGADNADVTDLASDIASGQQSYPPSNPDFNNDGGADNSDVTDLANVVAGGPCP